MAFSYQEAVDKYRQLIVDTQNYIWANPETGYREVKTGKYMEETFEKLGYTLERAGNIPGFYTVIDTGREGPEVLILGELDSLICADHPECDKETGAVHCCGHSAQCAALVGIAAALREPGALDGLSGKIKLCAVPAEELIEIEYRKGLVEKGEIKYLGGKTEFLHRGYFDSSDIAFMVHTSTGDGVATQKGSVGCIAKRVVYKGVSAHAGGSPWNGVNALYAANLGLMAANSIRETFREADRIRFHPIITSGGNAVNAIPDRVVIESYVRGTTFDAIKEANEKINRALIGAALSIGAKIEISDAPGYAPLINDIGMIELARDAAENLPGINCNVTDAVSTGCTDMGDLSGVIPSIHPYAGGATGTSHGSDYRIANVDVACVTSAKWQLEMLALLLGNGAERAKKIIADFKPTFESKKAYLDYIDSLNRNGDRITYNEDGSTASVELSKNTTKSNAQETHI